MLYAFPLQFFYMIGSYGAVIACVESSTKIREIHVKGNYGLEKVSETDDTRRMKKTPTRRSSIAF